jgi:hypothetical protein
MAKRSSFLVLIFAVVAIGAAHSERTARAALEYRCPTSVNVGITSVSEGWFLSYGSGRVELLEQAAVLERTMACSYGQFSLLREFPKGYTCAVLNPIGSRPSAFNCTRMKPPAVKIPGKKTNA